MDCRIKKINKEYFNILEELKKSIEQNDDIMPLLDKMEIFWLKNSDFLTSLIQLNKFSYVGGAMYIHFFEGEHRIPLALNNYLVMDEPICKTVNMIRAEEVIDKDRINEIIKNVVNRLLEDKKYIINSNTVIAPLRTFFDDKNDIHDLAIYFTNSFISESLKTKINEEKDIINLSQAIKTIDDFNTKVDTKNYFTCLEDLDLKSFDKIVNYCSYSGMRVNKDSFSSVLLAYYYSVYGLMCQAFDLLYMLNNFDYDLFVFRDAPMYYLNIIELNLDKKYAREKKLIRNANITHFMHKAFNHFKYLHNNSIMSKSKIKEIYKKIKKIPDLYSHEVLNPKVINKIIGDEIKK